MSIRKYNTTLRLFGIYFICIFLAAAFISSTTIRASHRKIEEAQQAALLEQLKALFQPAPITLQHEDPTGVKSLVTKHRQHRAKREQSKSRVTTTILAAVAPATALLPATTNENTEFGDDGKNTAKFVPQDKDIPVIPVKYAAGMDSIARAQIRSQIVAIAKKHLGTRYVYAGKKPGGFDCSGFTAYVMNVFGIVVSPSSRHQALQGKAKPLAQAEVGDLVFFSRYGKGGRISHVALVVNNTPDGVEVIHATSRGIVIDNINQSKYWRPKILFAKDVISM